MSLKELPSILKDKTLLLGVFVVLFLVLPGVFSIYVLDERAFAAYDWIKLVILGGAFVLPFAFANSILLSSLWGNDKASNDNIFYSFSLGTIFAGLGFYIALGIYWYVQYSGPSFFSALNFPATVTAVELLGAVAMWREERMNGTKPINSENSK